MIMILVIQNNQILMLGLGDMTIQYQYCDSVSQYTISYSKNIN